MPNSIELYKQPVHNTLFAFRLISLLWNEISFKEFKITVINLSVFYHIINLRKYIYLVLSFNFRWRSWRIDYNVEIAINLILFNRAIISLRIIK